MPPTFNKRDFTFKKGQEVPEYIEGHPGGYRDPNKYHLEGVDRYSSETYALASNIDDLPTAQALYWAHMRQVETNQPTSISGGPEGVQDVVTIVHPEEPEPAV